MHQHRVRIFVDYWNFQINWNERAPLRCDWPRVPAVLSKAATAALTQATLGALELEETRVYASYEPRKDHRLKQWLHGFLDKQPGIRVFTRERRTRVKAAHCRSCNADTSNCPICSEPFAHAVEKGVDTAIVTDLLSLAWEKAYDVALLVSSDADFVPAVERLQEKNIKVVNATWKGHGHELARASWASFELDSVAGELGRSVDSGGPTSGSMPPVRSNF
jgi:uncharacterized LabA/DUF88 family protein